MCIGKGKPKQPAQPASMAPAQQGVMKTAVKSEYADQKDPNGTGAGVGDLAQPNISGVDKKKKRKSTTGLEI